MRGPKVLEWERRLKKVFDEIDHTLEDEYHGELPLHPCRPARGTTANPEADGLFNVGASYTTGLGTEHGEGYSVDIRLSSLKNVSPELRKEVNARVKALLDEKLPAAFPNNRLHVTEHGYGLKIHGDISVKD
ncbi:hypothetical protein ACFLQY_01840 [Verrucomicrobiota bacterium]